MMSVVFSMAYRSFRKFWQASTPATIRRPFRPRHPFPSIAHNAALKYECVYLHAWETGSQAKAAIGSWITFYNLRRPHTAHGGKPPAVVCFNSIETDQHAQTVA